MKNFWMRPILFNLCITLLTSFCHGTINFGSKNSRISVLPGARLNIGTSTLSIDGTLSQATGGQITGNVFTFENGILEQGTSESLLNGNFNPSATEVLQFTGDGILRGEPGSLIYGVLISGINNVISGQPTFVLPLNLLDTSSEVIIDIQNSLSQNLHLNGGVAILKNNLTLGDDVKIVGPGIVDLNNRELTLGCSYTNSWTGDIVFEHASSLALTGSISLNGTWYFNNDSDLIGNGAILDLSGGGKIVLGANTTLYLEDVIVNGLGDVAGQIIFTSTTSKIFISNVEMSLNSDYTVTTGAIVVEGTSKFNHGPYNFNINSDATLTVNGTVLWLEAFDTDPLIVTGSLNVSRAIYDSAIGYNAANVAANIADGTLIYLNDGLIKRTISSTGSSVEDDLATRILLSGDVHVDVTMNKFIFVPADKTINYTGTTAVTLDGRGSAITFPDSDTPKFVVQSGTTVNLVDVTFANITSNTFNVMPGGQINIGDNVTFQFSESVTMQTPWFNILPGGHLTMRGAEGSIVITLYDSNNPNSSIINIDGSTLSLTNITLSGINHIAYTPGNLIELLEEANVNIDTSTSLNFKAYGDNNSLSFLVDDLTLFGLIVFGDKSVNELHIRFALLDGLAPDRIIAKERYPLFNIAGGPGFVVGGPNTGTSRLIFDDPYVVLDLLNSNAIQLDTNAQLKYEELEIRTNPIKQYSSRVVDNGTEMHGLKIDNSFIRSYTSNRGIHFNQLEEINLRNAVRNPGTQKMFKQSCGEIAEKNPLKIRKESIKQERNAILNLNTMPTRGNMKFLHTGIIEPESFDQQYSGQYVNSTSPFSGNIEMRYSQFDNFTVDPLVNLGLYMKEGSQILQTTQDVAFVYGKHTVNIMDRGNKVSIQQEMHFDNNLFIAPNSSIEFDFVTTGYENPTLVFDAGTVIDVAENSTLIFSGNGRVVFSEGVIIRLSATVNSKTKEFENKANLIFTNGAILDFADGANSSIVGIGNLVIQHAAAIKPTAAGGLTIGATIMDEISVKVIDNSQICLENPYIDGTSRVSLQKLVTSVNFENGGMLIVGANGLFELNALNNAVSSGIVTELSFGNNGFLVVKDNGIFRFAENRLKINTQKNYDFNWIGFLSNITGGGYISYKDNTDLKSFTGQLVGTSPELFTNVSDMTFEHLAYLFVDKMPVELETAIWYLKPDGLGVVVTENNVKVNLIEGDIVEREDEKGNIYGTNGTKEFKISANGARS